MTDSGYKQAYYEAWKGQWESHQELAFFMEDQPYEAQGDDKELLEANNQKFQECDDKYRFLKTDFIWVNKGIDKVSKEYQMTTLHLSRTHAD
jgi:hypothetical protein